MQHSAHPGRQTIHAPPRLTASATAASTIATSSPSRINRRIPQAGFALFDAARHHGFRKSFADYRPTGEARHDDLLILYMDPAGGSRCAVYFDSEGHVIHDKVTVPEANSIVFDSEPSQPGPKFCLTYRLDGKQLNGKFEIAQPGQSEYKTYLSWTSIKK
jgi:hypothetical protein